MRRVVWSLTNVIAHIISKLPAIVASKKLSSDNLLLIEKGASSYPTKTKSESSSEFRFCQ
jgi:hypothetical protein